MRAYLYHLVIILMISAAMAGCTKVKENNPPIITSVSLNPKIVTPGSSALIEVKATDNDGDLIIYSYTPSAGIVFGTGANVSWLAPDTAGVYSLKVKVSDDSGDYTMDSISLTVSNVTTPTQIKGTATFSTGLEGDLSYSRVSIYSSLADREADLPQKSIITGLGSFSIINFTMDSITPGDYYLDIWKDNDNSFSYSNGDYLGWYGSGNLLNPNLSMLHIVEGETTHINVQMFIY
jgi:hypothetical protein